MLLIALFNVLVRGDDSRLNFFYERISKSDVKYCADRTRWSLLAWVRLKIHQISYFFRMLPDCIACIPGTVPSPGSKSCNTFIPESKSIRDEIYNLTLERFPNRTEDRKFGLYPCEHSTSSILSVTFLFISIISYYLQIWRNQIS